MISTTFNIRCRINEELGKGGMGTVHRAYDIALRRDVAVKLLSYASLGTEGKTSEVQQSSR